MYKHMLHAVVKISMMFAKYFEYCTIILKGGGAFFCGHAVYTVFHKKNSTLCYFIISLLWQLRIA